MAGGEDEETGRQEQLQKVLAAYLQAVDAGQTPDRQKFLADHPDLAAELASFFTAADQVDRMAGPGQSPVQHAGAPASGQRPDPPPEAGGDPARDVPETVPDSLSGMESSPCPTTAQWGTGDASAIPELKSPLGTIRYFGDYELLEELAHGGMGIVYKARQVTLNRLVALKLILAGRLASESDVARFRIEAEAAAGLDHPNIVPIHEVGQHQGLHYYSMKLVEGGSLVEKIPHLIQQPRAAARLLSTVARAVHFAHERGILHRDLKPANILLDHEDRPHIIDFGLAKQLQADAGLTRSGLILGTPAYMAPEQAAGRKSAVTTAADVYSLGAILYELLTGRPPFQAQTAVETLMKLRHEEPVRPSRLNAQADQDLETICLKCLEKDPRRRYGSAEVLADDLDRWLAGEPIRARRVPPWERAVKWARRQPAVAALLGVVVLVTILGLAGIFRQWRQTHAALRREQSQRLRAEGLAEANRRNLYAARINLAHQAWKRSDISRANELLESLRPGPDQVDLRGFEWFYLQRLCAGERITLRGHEGAVRSLAFSPDGKTLASAGDDHIIRLWNVADGRQRQALLGHQGWVGTLAFSPDGKTLASGGDDRAPILWDAASGERMSALPKQAAPVSTLAFSPDGKLLAWAGAHLATGAGNPVERFVTDSAPGEITLWDLSLKKERFRLKGHTNGVLALAFSPDGKTLASASADSSIRLRDPATGTMRAILSGHRGPVVSLAFSGGSKALASASLDHTIRVWDLLEGKELYILAILDSPCFTLAFAPDGHTLAAGGYDRIIRVWDLAVRRKPREIRGHDDYVWSLAFAPDGRTLASASWDGTIKLWDPSETQQSTALYDPGPGETPSSYSLAFSPDGRLLATAAFDVSLWDIATRRRVVTLADYKNGDICLAFTPDGRVLASAGTDGVITLWDATSWRTITTLVGHSRKICSLAFSPDGKLLASGGADRTLRLWDWKAHRQVAELTAHKGWVRAVAFSPDGKTLATGSFDATVKLWDVARQVEIETFSGHAKAVDAVVFAPDNKTLASMSEDRTARLWDLETGRERAILKGHTDFVYAGAFSPDGKTLATAGWDGAVRLWHVDTGQELGVLTEGGSQAWSVSFSPDRTMLAAGVGGGVELWRTTRQANTDPRSVRVLDLLDLSPAYTRVVAGWRGAATGRRVVMVGRNIMRMARGR